MNGGGHTLLSALVSFYQRICARAMKWHVCAGLFYLPAWRDHLRVQGFLRRQDRLQRIREKRRPRDSAGDGGKVAVVIPWFGKDISGGAETAAYGLVQALQTYAPDIQVEVLTTTLPEFAQHWNAPTHPAGTQEEDGILVRRFDPDCRDRHFFDFVNGQILMPGSTKELLLPDNTYRSPLPACLESYYLMRMVWSSSLVTFIEENWDEYEAFAFIPYMFATTVAGCAAAGSKSILIPCLHDERYACMRLYSRVFAKVASVLCHVRSEAALFSHFYPQAPQPQALGVQVNTDVEPGDPDRFRSKYGIRGPFILYAGRQVSGKNVPLLIDYFRAFRQTHEQWSGVQLVLIGKGDLDYSNEPGVRALGFIPPQDKIDAYRAATALAMLSVNESFSIVMMEAWLQETPAIVSSECPVTRDHIFDSGGGEAVANADEFGLVLSRWLEQPQGAQQQGRKGREYVLANFTATIIAERFRDALDDLRPHDRK